MTNDHGGSPAAAAHPTDPDLVRARFSWTPPAGAELGGVYLWANRLTDKRHTSRGMMRRRPDGSWSLNLDVPRDVMATYRFLPLPHDHPALHSGPLPPPRELLRHGIIDESNPAAAAGSPFGSVLVGPDAPGVDAWAVPHRAPSEYVNPAGDGPVRCRLAAPPGEGPADLLVVFDADSWFDRLRLPGVLAATGRRCAVLGVDSPADPGARLRFLGDHDALFAVVRSAIARARHGTRAPRRTIVAGQSLGGVAALAFAAAHPDLVDEVLAYSPSVWWRPGRTGRPADVTAREDWIHDLVAACRPGAFGIRLASGRFEEELTPGVAALAATARSAGHAFSHTVYAGGHDEAWWAALLLDHLTAA